MMRVLVILTNPKQASFRLRISILHEPLAESGIELSYGIWPRSLRERLRLIASASEYDAVILQRRLLDAVSGRLLRRRARRIYYDIDDALMYPSGHESWWSNRKRVARFRHTAAIVDHAVVGNTYLAEHFERAGCRVSILPTVLDASRYQIKPHGEQPPRLVWIGSRSTLPHLQSCLPGLERAAAALGELELVTIADVSPSSQRLAIRHIPWSEAGEAAALIQGNIGIAPLPVTPWTLGKCGFKILQYMAAGLPTIASPVGANAEIIVEHTTGLLATTAEQWEAAIVRLAGDGALRRDMGRAARQRVEEHYSIERAVTHWRKLLLEPSGEPSAATL